MVRRLYGPVRNLHCFIHPTYKRRFRFMTKAVLLKLSKKIVEAIDKSSEKKVLISETGASPFARICQKLLEKSTKKVDWLSIKFPRDPQGGLFEVLRFYLTPYERRQKSSMSTTQTREEILRSLCAQVTDDQLIFPQQSLEETLDHLLASRTHRWQKAIQAVFEGTKIACFLQEPVLLFDEYVDSGKTVANTVLYLSCFVAKPKIRLISYFVNKVDARSHPAIAFTLFDQTEQCEAFSLGVYPFENRVDLIGHFYYMRKEKYQRIELSVLKNLFSQDKIGMNVEGFLQRLRNTLRRNKPSARLKQDTTIEAVRDFIGTDHLLRFSLFLLEKDSCDDTPVAELLWLLFDLYGPIWSPLPDAYHIDFWRGFEQMPEFIRSIPEWNDLKKEYKCNRSQLLREILEVCEDRRQHWLKKFIKPLTLI